jgi:hypothetical protein
MATMTRAEWLDAYAALEPERERVAALFDDANCGKGSFEHADTVSFDLNEQYRDLAHVAAEVLRETHSTDEVGGALNKAADDILEATEAEDEGLRDGLNLLVNATTAYLTGEAEDLETVAEKNYDAELDSIIGWIQQGIR